MKTVLGIDMGTQSIKFLVYDYENERAVALSQRKLDLISSADGTSEQKAEWWVDAAAGCAADIPAEIMESVRAVGVSGQQHGFVPLDDAGKPLYNVKLWNDVSTAEECSEITKAFGGSDSLVERVGNPVLPGYTASKLLWLKKNKPRLYGNLAHILLPHDYMNFILTGRYTAEYGDASGTAFFDVRRRSWSEEVLRVIDPDRDLVSLLPKLNEAGELAGFVTGEASKLFGIPEGIPVSSGGGDNMMGAIGTGAVKEGVLTMSMGTSGTIYVYSEKPLIDPDGKLAAFCSSTGGWLPLLCTMNCTVATEQLRELLETDINQLNELAGKSVPGANGVTVLPYFSGERTPSLPRGRAVIAGLNLANTTKADILRASMESAVFGLRLGYEALVKLGVEAHEIRLIGGGAKSALWRQIAADVLNARVVTLRDTEAAAFGAALQALWALEKSEGSGIGIEDICDRHVKLNEKEITEPDIDGKTGCMAAYGQYLDYLGLLKPKFE